MVDSQNLAKPLPVNKYIPLIHSHHAWISGPFLCDKHASDPNMASVEAGLVLSGKYRLERPIGRGGMGWVWRAQHVQWAAPVAIKLIDVRQLAPRADAPVPTADSPLLQRFFGEARAAAAIRSPHVVQILDHGVDPQLQLPFIVMELLEGETLEQRLSRERRLNPEAAANILTQVARALTRVHEANMVHRDLKPSNVFLVANDEDVLAKVLDFGIAKGGVGLGTGTPITATGEQMGTPFYMSPEQIRGQRDIDFKADLWAFGVIAFECLTGSRPFNGETLGALSLNICVEPLPEPSQLVPVPPAFDAWFLRCVARDRTTTFGSVKEAADGLRTALGGRVSIPTGPITADHHLSKTQTFLGPAPALDTTVAAVSSARATSAELKRRRTATWIAVITVLVAVGAGTYALRSTSTPEAHSPTDHPEVSMNSSALPFLDPPHTVVLPTPHVASGSSSTPTPSSPAPSVDVSAVTREVAPEKPQAADPTPVSRAKPRQSQTPKPSSATPVAPSSSAPRPPEETSPKTPHDLIENRL